MDGAVGGCFGKVLTMSELTFQLLLILLIVWIIKR